ncbi:MAG: hypothetical protein AAGM67_14750, partial [Bacteroidota bacterium]
ALIMSLLLGGKLIFFATGEVGFEEDELAFGERLEGSVLKYFPIELDAGATPIRARKHEQNGFLLSLSETLGLLEAGQPGEDEEKSKQACDQF